MSRSILLEPQAGDCRLTPWNTRYIGYVLLSAAITVGLCRLSSSHVCMHNIRRNNQCCHKHMQIHCLCCCASEPASLSGWLASLALQLLASWLAGRAVAHRWHNTSVAALERAQALVLADEHGVSPCSPSYSCPPLAEACTCEQQQQQRNRTATARNCSYDYGSLQGPRLSNFISSILEHIWFLQGPSSCAGTACCAHAITYVISRVKTP